jgi:hypothetical protein
MGMDAAHNFSIPPARSTMNIKRLIAVAGLALGLHTQAQTPTPAPGPTMDETVSFINTKMVEQAGVNIVKKYADGPYRDNMSVTQTIQLGGSCAAHVHVHVEHLYFYQQDLDLKLAAIAPRDVHLLPLSEWKLKIEPPTVIPGDVNSQTDRNIYENQMESSTDPELYIVTYGDQRLSAPFLGVFSDKRIADRVATAYIHAFSLCHKAEAF